MRSLTFGLWGSIGTTAENLNAAIAGETFEFMEMYPPMIQKAEEEEHKAARRSFTYANAVEIEHASLYQQALAQMESSKRLIITSVRFAGTPAQVRRLRTARFADPPPRLSPGWIKTRLRSKSSRLLRVLGQFAREAAFLDIEEREEEEAV